MRKTNWVGTIALGLVSLVVLAGCGGGKTAPTPELETKGKLQEVGAMLRLYASQTNRAPTKLGDLASFQNSMFETYQTVKSGDIIVVWGVKMPGEGDKGDDTVVAYEKQAKTDKGFVLLNNGNIVSMDPTGLEAALKKK